ncbi:protein of unknown function (plasmid) [Paraburkholderia dioscoreae]|uniref:Uncharacterized protein n=1 Tax=Paraburkholderia dioscoreae TaxID=2604047 RepID=A0A5Q4YWR4_9BURK|nr:protein of unknown function [Paraburkholderia dioscoreae]
MWGGMERLATDTAPRALTQRRTWLRSRERTANQGSGFRQREQRRSETPRGERPFAVRA